MTAEKIRCDACPVMCYIAPARPAPATGTPTPKDGSSAPTPS
jgi:hypothetical protein